MIQLKQKEGAIHSLGACFVFESIGNAQVQILLSRINRPDGSVRYMRDREWGPFGNTALIAKDLEAMKPEWKEVAAAMVEESFRLIQFCEGFKPDYWKAPLQDMTKPPAAKESPAASTEAMSTNPEPGMNIEAETKEKGNAYEVEQKD